MLKVEGGRSFFNLNASGIKFVAKRLFVSPLNEPDIAASTRGIVAEEIKNEVNNSLLPLNILRIAGIKAQKPPTKHALKKAKIIFIAK